jgi:regulatory protein
MNNSDEAPTPAMVNASVLRMAAMNLLAMREHSRAELQKKLSQRFENHPGVETVLQQLIADGLQSDSRFADAFTRMRFRQGKGPRRITQELADRGVSSSLTQAALQDQELDWFELCLNTRTRRFSDQAPADLKDKARQIRFLQYRGFDTSQIQYALDTKSQ